MLRSASKFLLLSALALAATGTALLVDVNAADAATTATIRVSGAVNVRSGPTNTAALVATIKNKTKVSIDCKVTGQYTRGPVRNTAQWDRLTTGQYISHAYAVTTTDIPTCTPPAAAPAPASHAPIAGPTGTNTNAEFLAASIPPAQQSQRDTRVPASVTLAQAILESTWGRSSLSTNDKNFFGMKCFTQGTQANGCHSYVTNECTTAGVCSTTTAIFRTYPTALNSFRDHGLLLANAPRYQAAFNYLTNPNQFAAEVHKAGYATDPNYTTKLIALMTKYNLYQYDIR